MQEAIIVINAGSSSIKFTVFTIDGSELNILTTGQVSGIKSSPKFKAKDSEDNTIAEKKWGEDKVSGHDKFINYILSWIEETFKGVKLVAAGHRLVHGGLEYTKPTIVNDDNMAKIESFIQLAPLHMPHNIAPIKILANSNPSLKQVACFDTAFHRTMPEIAQLYPIPRKLIEENHIRRYGMHGLSYEYIAETLNDIAPDVAKGKVVVAHIGSGASLAAIEDGKSVATTMGFTALEGVPMGTRPGSIDPGILLWLVQNKGYGGAELENFLYHECGMLGFSEVSNDFYEIEISDDPKAKQAYALMAYNVARHVGSLCAALNGLDALVFTAGVGERGPLLRKPICDTLTYLGIEIDEKANDNNDLVISKPSSKVKVMVVPTNEELMIAKHTLKLI